MMGSNLWLVLFLSAISAGVGVLSPEHCTDSESFVATSYLALK